MPEDKAIARILLGVVGYLLKFAPNLSDAAAPLRDQVRKDVLFRWDEDVHVEIKEILSEPPVL